MPPLSSFFTICLSIYHIRELNIPIKTIFLIIKIMNKFKSMLSSATLMFIVALFSTFSLNGWAASPADDGGTTTKNEVWRVKGTYKSAVYGTEKETYIVRYDDGSYSILSPYAEGFDNVSFTVNGDGTITPLQGSYSAYNGSYIYLYVEEGHDLMIYSLANSKFSGNRYSGFVYFEACMYETDYPYGDVGNYGKDYFEWESDEQPSADDLSGVWAGKNYIYDYLGRRNALQVLEGTSDISIAKNEDGTYSIKGFYGGTTDNITATYDKDKKTLTINPVSGFRSKYTLADFSSPETPIVGYMDDNQNILFTNFTLWDGDTRKTEMDSRCVLRRND